MDFAMHQKELRMRVYTYIEFSTVQESQFIYYVQNCALLKTINLSCLELCGVLLLSELASKTRTSFHIMFANEIY